MDDFVTKMLLSLAVGGLIGLEREASKKGLLGLRTFSLVSLIGMISVMLSSDSLLVPATGFALVFLLSIVYYYLRTQADRRVEGLTTTLALPLTFFLGVLIGKGFFLEAGAAAIISTYLLLEKQKVHEIIDTISKEEILDGLIFAIIAFVIYPLIPLQPVQVLGQSFDLRYFWTIVILLNFISFSAHVLLKYTKKNGLLYASILGGAVSALATLFFFSKDSDYRDYKLLRLVFSGAMVGSIAGDVILLLFINQELFLKSLIALGSLLILLVGCALYYSKTTYSTAGLLSLKRRPLSLKFAIEFSVILFAVSIAMNYAVSSVSGVYAVSLVGGVFSLTSVFASAALLYSKHSISTQTAVSSLLIGVLGSMLSKVVILLSKTRGRNSFALVLIPLTSLLLALLLNFLAAGLGLA